MENIPVDIIALEILPKLPLRTLVRFKRLNKWFDDCISSKVFINRHLQQSVSSNKERPIMVFTGEKDGHQCLYLMDDVDSPARHLPLPPPLSDGKTYRSRSVVATCRGLTCLSIANIKDSNQICHKHAIIVNPFTRKVVANISMCYSIDLKIRLCIGFGYDSLNDDYKIVEIEYSFDRCSGDLISHKVRVYSMNSNSWKTVDDTTTCLYGNFIGYSVLVENHLPHWLFRNSKEKKRKIVCFDLEKEQWAADVALPDFEDVCRQRFREAAIVLGVLDGCLCLTVYNLKSQVDGQIDGWIMKEYGVHQSWTKFSIQDSGCYCRTMLPNVKGAVEEIVLIKGEDTDEEGMVETYEWYNIRDKTRKKFLLRGAGGAPRSLQIKSLCFPSLVARDYYETESCKATHD